MDGRNLWRAPERCLETTVAGSGRPQRLGPRRRELPAEQAATRFGYSTASLLSAEGWRSVELGRLRRRPGVGGPWHRPGGRRLWPGYIGISWPVRRSPLLTVDSRRSKRTCRATAVSTDRLWWPRFYRRGRTRYRGRLRSRNRWLTRPLASPPRAGAKAVAVEA